MVRIPSVSAVLPAGLRRPYRKRECFGQSSPDRFSHDELAGGRGKGGRVWADPQRLIRRPARRTSSTWPCRILARTSSSPVIMAWGILPRWRKSTGAENKRCASFVPRNCVSLTSVPRRCKSCWEMSRGSTCGTDTPPIQGEWSLSIDLLYVDGTRKNIFAKKMKPGVRDFFFVEPNTRLNCHMSTKTTAVKIPMKFQLTLSPVMYSVYPDFQPMPYRTIFD